MSRSVYRYNVSLCYLCVSLTVSVVSVKRQEVTETAKSVTRTSRTYRNFTMAVLYIESDFTHNYVASQKINVKRKRSHCLVAIFFFFVTSICTQDMHFHPTARKFYLNNFTLSVCLRNARTTYFIFRNDYLQPFQEGLKEEKEKKTRSSQKKKLSHQAHDVKITSY